MEVEPMPDVDVGPGEEEDQRARNPSRVVLPAVPPALSEAFCLLNCFSPGLGTFFASISCCCSRTRGMSKTEIVASVFVGLFIALLQLLLTPFLFVGWIWSCFWGILLTAQSDAYYKPQSERERAARGMLPNPLAPAQTHPEPPPPYTFYDDYFQRGRTPPPPYSFNPPANTTVQEVAPPLPVVLQPVNQNQIDNTAQNEQDQEADSNSASRNGNVRPERASSAPSARVHFVSETAQMDLDRSRSANGTSNTLPDVG